MRLKRFLPVPIAVAILAIAAFSQTLPQGVQKVASVEGITEYAFPNGLHVLLDPDNSKPKITVNVVYLVGSRNEGYGETGMAHLLEHMVFKTAKSGRELFKELTDRTGGGNFNGTTSYDQTMYFETFNASDENLRWALGLEADRMVNMTMEKKDLDTEMTVVRNEMESGENSPLNVLEERVLAAAYNFHNYGKTVIGARTDVERVPIENLAVFYRKYYQPDNAVLIVAGQFDESKALAEVAATLGAIPKTAAHADAAVHRGTDAGRRAVRHAAAGGRHPGDHGGIPHTGGFARRYGAARSALPGARRRPDGPAVQGSGGHQEGGFRQLQCRATCTIRDLPWPSRSSSRISTSTTYGRSC